MPKHVAVLGSLHKTYDMFDGYLLVPKVPRRLTPNSMHCVWTV